jgi:cobalamin biosynthesis protein CobT
MLFVIFSVSGSIINAYAQQFSGNRSSTRVDPGVESLENGQLLSTPGPSANDLGAPPEQTDNNQEEVANIEPELDEQEPASQDSAEVNEDDISSNIKQEGSQEEEEQSAGDEQESNSDEEDNNADESENEKKNNIPLNFKATTGLPFP